VRGAQWKPYGSNSRVLVPQNGVDISPVKAAALAVHGVTAGASAAGGWMMSLP
jgi:hypothetical protein